MKENESSSRGLLTRRGAAAFLKVTERSVDNWRRSGKIQSIKIGRLVRFSPQALQAFIDNQRAG